LRKTLPAVCDGLIPIPSSVIIAEVAAGTLNSSAANLRTAVNGVVSGTESLQKKIHHDYVWDDLFLLYLHFKWKFCVTSQCDFKCYSGR